MVECLQKSAAQNDALAATAQLVKLVLIIVSDIRTDGQDAKGDP